MKTTNKILSLLVASTALASCADLDTEYLGDVVSASQKEEVLEMDPGKALASVTGCFAAFLSSGFDSSGNHYDFGFSSMMIGLDSQGQDMPVKYIGYNWYNDWEGYGGGNDSGTPTYMAWALYSQIGLCNTLLSTIPADTDNGELMLYRAQGLALRAFDYWVLAQLYQFNYSIAPNELCVPVITDENMEEAAAEGMACSTVTEVYDQILADINGAVTLLENCGLTPASVISSKPRRAFSLAAAYGLRARVYLSMHKYAEAARDAQAAINNFNGRPYTRAEVSVPTFVSINDPSWMWGIAVEPTDRVSTSGIVNFPAMMGSFNYGYPTVGAWKWINKKLYETISVTDVRKGWWLDENFTSPNLNAQQQAYLDDYLTDPNVTPDDGTAALMPYTQVKYAPYNNELGCSNPASDVPLMRVEEMYLTLAEATGMSQGVEAGKQILVDFVKTYRDPEYVCKITEQEAFQDECWRQRRIELWGEGLSFYDLMRLNKGMDRVDGYFPSQVTYKLEPNDPLLIYCIPLSEIQNNKKIDKSVNEHRGGPRPEPVINQ